jgi:hypothetical protein
MSLAAIGSGASYEFRWRSWALLRDALAEYLDGNERFPSFFAIGDALVAGRIHLVAAALGSEIEQIRSGLVGKTLDDLVLGPKTASILHGGRLPKTSRPLTRIEVSNIRHPGGAEELTEYFATMLDSFARVCAHPNQDGTIEFVDG